MGTERLALKIMLFGLFISGSMVSAAEISAENLRCEYRANPLGIDAPAPRLSWEIAAGGDSGQVPRGLRQTAYRVLVASSAKLLAADTGDLWDSGKVNSGRSTLRRIQGQGSAVRDGVLLEGQKLDGRPGRQAAGNGLEQARDVDHGPAVGR